MRRKFRNAIRTVARTVICSVLCALFGVPSANAQDASRVQFGGGAGLVLPSPEAVLIDSDFYPDVRNGPSQTLDKRTEFVWKAPDWFGDVVVYLTPRIGVMGQVVGTRASHPIFMQARGIINSTQSRAYLGGMRVNLRCCMNGVPFVYGLAGLVRSRSRVAVGDSHTVEGPSDTSLGMAFGGGAETPGWVSARVTADLITASRRMRGGDDWTWRLNVGFAVAVRRHR